RRLEPGRPRHVSVPECDGAPAGGWGVACEPERDASGAHGARPDRANVQSVVLAGAPDRPPGPDEADDIGEFDETIAPPRERRPHRRVIVVAVSNRQCEPDSAAR